MDKDGLAERILQLLALTVGATYPPQVPEEINSFAEVKIKLILLIDQYLESS